MTNSGGTGSYGTIFKITPGGTFTGLRYLNYTTDGGNPTGGLVQSAGNFYGMTYRGGANSQGTIFKITASGSLPS